MAFSFYNRQDGTGIRLLFNQQARGGMSDEFMSLQEKSMRSGLDEPEQNRLQELRLDLQQRLMDLPLEEIFTSKRLTDSPPRPARILRSLTCETCGENTMESRTRRFAGKTLCILCYRKVEQKV